MITRRLARPLGALTSNSWTCPSCARKALLPTLQQRRTLIRVPPMTHEKSFEKEGVPGLLSSTGFSIAWTEYQGVITRKLNELVAGEPIENDQPRNLLIRYARDPMNASLFNHASMAFNNHFFFTGLSSTPASLDQHPSLQQSLEKTFGSIDTLRATMLDTAAAMFGPGFVWLVWSRKDAESGAGGWRILSTYIAGTPFPEAGYRRQGLDTATSTGSNLSDYQNALPVNNAGAFGANSRSGRTNATIPPGGTQIMPVLCVNTWEHVYIYDYGLGGKRKYLSDWWEAVDWSAVDNNTPLEVKGPQKLPY